MSTITNTVTTAIGEVLQATNRDRSDLGRLLGFDKSTISRRFTSGNWKLDELSRICEVVGAPVTVLFDPDEMKRWKIWRIEHGPTVLPLRGTKEQGETPTGWYVPARGIAA